MNPKGEKTWGALRSTQAELTFLHENWAGRDVQHQLVLLLRIRWQTLKKHRAGSGSCFWSS